ncbi:MAG: 16S rRNA (adenine(1518)-N(6)/adenine(1519)-N(6))-dimethyltransferase RsmA [bacterium]
MIQDLLRKHDIRLNKSLGQHFLSDTAQLKKIADAASLCKDDIVLEVGTGIGTLTEYLAQKAGFVVSVELDRKLIPAAEKYLKDFKNIEIINEDIMKCDIPKILNKYSNFKHRKVVANVPYNITTPLITLLIGSKAKFSSIVLTIQEEVARRITSKPGIKQYGSFTVYVNYYARPEIKAIIPNSAFVPPPKVSSAVLRLDILDEPPVKVKDEKMFFRIVRAAFNQRRKMLKNALEAAHIKWPDGSGIDGKRRGETLSMEEFAKLADCF